MNKIATKTSWKNLPMDQPKRIKMNLVFNDDEYEKLIKGLLPRQMEDKWFIYFEDEWLHFHRSWSGCETYKAKVEPGPDGYAINEFWVERNPEKYKNTDDKEDMENLYFLIGRGLLHIDVGEVFCHRNVHNENDALKVWSDFGSLMSPPQASVLLDDIRAVLFGVAVGDALGVPVEFQSREELKEKPVTDMIGYGTHHVPPGTWSDDSSLTFCLAEALMEQLDLYKLAQNFKDWLFRSCWTATGTVFDVGITTRNSIQKLTKGIEPQLAGGTNENENGNGSLMRILPLVFYTKDRAVADRYEITKAVSSITHAHVRSVIACFYYLEFALVVLKKQDKFLIYKDLQTSIPGYLRSIGIDESEIRLFDRLFTMDIHELPEREIQSSGYVVHTLEASTWCLLTTGSYEEAVLKAVNLGEDTDTTGAVTGGLAGLLYGIGSIPGGWLSKLARRNDIEVLARRLDVGIADQANTGVSTAQV